MSLATDARYRSLLVNFTNNEQDGSEFVQLLAKPSGGSWAAQRTFPVSLAADQEVTWETALPVTAYDIALRYLQGSVPAVGYESSDPDAWTAATAAGSKGTVTTSSAAATGLAGTAFVDSSTPITLTWSCTQLEVPFLIEKNAGAGWVTVVADLVATSYQYTIPAAELGGTTQFRVTPKRGSVAGPVSGTASVLMAITVGATAFTSGVFTADNVPPTIDLAWSAATSAINYLLEISTDGGTVWNTVGTVSGLTYRYNVNLASQINASPSLQFRVRGQNGSTQGASATTTVATTVTVGAMGTVTVTWTPYGVANLYCGSLTVSWATVSGATTYLVERKIGAGAYVSLGYTSGLTMNGYSGGVPFSYVNTEFTFRVTPVYAFASISGSSNTSTPVTTTYSPTITISSAVAGGSAEAGYVMTVTFSGGAVGTFLLGAADAAYSYGISGSGVVSGVPITGLDRDWTGSYISARVSESDTTPAVPVLIS